jgi:hypothetical protein
MEDAKILEETKVSEEPTATAEDATEDPKTEE